MISPVVLARFQGWLDVLRRAERLALRFAFAIVILLGLWSARDLVGSIISFGEADFQVSPLGDGVKTDDDSVRARIGLDAKPDFASTFAFWVGNWTQGEMGPPTPFGPYFRPLTSQLWWLERAVSGGSLRFFLTVHLLWHLAFCLALWATLRMMWNGRVALLTLALWTTAVAQNFHWSTLHGAIPMWKDDPEMTVGLCVLGAMAATWRLCQTQQSRYVAWGAGCFFIGIAFKESAYITPFFVVLTLGLAGQLKRHWRVAALYFAMAVAFYAYRTVVLQGPGGHHGTNWAWRQRAFGENIAGSLTSYVLGGDALGVALGCAILALVLWRFRRRRAAWCWGLLGACLALWSEWGYYVAQGAWGISLLRLSNVFDWQGTPYQQVPMALLMLWLFHYLLSRRPPLMVWGYGWILMAYLPLFHHAVTGHGFYENRSECPAACGGDE